jgi:hypothetical protein
MGKAPVIVAMAILLFIPPATLRAETLRVPADYPSIQAAIDRARPGDIAIRINQPPAPVTAVGNRFWNELGHPGISILGDTGIVEDNRVEKKRLHP